MSTNSKLRALATKLPPRQEMINGTPLYTKKQVAGITILANNPKAETRDGRPIEGDKYYIAEAPKLVDHFKKLKAVFVLHGQKGVEAYVNEVTKPKETAV